MDAGKEYFVDLGKWQAASHPDLANSKPEELFPPEFAEKYRLQHNHLWSRITRIHGTLLTVTELEGFPFDHIYGPYEGQFWQLVSVNFLEMACLMLHALVSDEGPDVLSLISFANHINTAPWCSNEKLELLRNTLRERKFDASVRDIKDRVKMLRDTSIAHALVGEPSETPTSVTLRELWELFHATHTLFGAITFGGVFATLAGDLMPTKTNGQERRTSLQKILDLVLRESGFVTRPERRARWWESERQMMAAADLKLMNEMRKRVGLPEA